MGQGGKISPPVLECSTRSMIVPFVGVPYLDIVVVLNRVGTRSTVLRSSKSTSTSTGAVKADFWSVRCWGIIS